MRLPKLPSIALGVVLILWASARWQLARVERSIRPIQGPEFAVQPGTQGSWEPTLAEWRELRGRPCVIVRGYPFAIHGTNHGASLFLRVHPPEALELDPPRTIDADGWFETAEEDDTLVCLTPSEVKRIEYRVGQSGTNNAGTASLRICGSRDGLALKDIIVNAEIANSLGVFCGFVILVWLFIANSVRARRNDGVLAGREHAGA